MHLLRKLGAEPSNGNCESFEEKRNLLNILLFACCLAGVSFFAVAFAAHARGERERRSEVDEILRGWGIASAIRVRSVQEETGWLAIMPEYHCSADALQPIAEVCGILRKAKGYRFRETIGGCSSSSGDISIEVVGMQKDTGLEIVTVGSP